MLSVESVECVECVECDECVECVECVDNIERVECVERVIGCAVVSVLVCFHVCVCLRGLSVCGCVLFASKKQ